MNNYETNIKKARLKESQKEHGEKRERISKFKERVREMKSKEE